jgi:hypothetical protein
MCCKAGWRAWGCGEATDSPLWRANRSTGLALQSHGCRHREHLSGFNQSSRDSTTWNRTRIIRAHPISISLYSRRQYIGTHVHSFEEVPHSLLNLLSTIKPAASVALHSHIATPETLASYHTRRHGTLKIANATIIPACRSIVPPVSIMGIRLQRYRGIWRALQPGRACWATCRALEERGCRA